MFKLIQNKNLLPIYLLGSGGFDIPPVKTSVKQSLEPVGITEFAVTTFLCFCFLRVLEVKTYVTPLLATFRSTSPVWSTTQGRRRKSESSVPLVQRSNSKRDERRKDAYLH